MSPFRAYLTRPMLTPQSVTPTAAQRSDFLRLVFLQLARLERLAVVLGGGDLPRAEADTERGERPCDRDACHPQQRVGVAGIQRVELPWRHLLDGSGRAAEVERARRLHRLDDHQAPVGHRGCT